LAWLYEPNNEKREVGGGAPEAAGCEGVQRSCGLNQKDAKSKASSIAVKAAQDAKAANDAQVAAGEAASMQVKVELADKAVQAARRRPWRQRMPCRRIRS